ncbi:MAG: PDDEXK nuclease domain-containing protein [Candidatus Methanoperedens sp.]
MREQSRQSDVSEMRNDFQALVKNITRIHDELAKKAVHAVNTSLTLRNWMIGMHIAEYELNGEDRGHYGEKLFQMLAEKLSAKGVSNCNRRQLYRYLKFYRTYPQIVETLSPQFKNLLPDDISTFGIVGTVSPQMSLPSKKIFNCLSYSHFELLTELDDSMKRIFYEIECLRGNWSVRELKRQIATLYYERSGLSKDKKRLSELVRSGVETACPIQVIRDPYVFEFLGLNPKEVMNESDLEGALHDKLQQFLLELGHGFCFEARQKRILIGDEHFFVDMVFYHRILKCHVLIELKVGGFNHEYLGQLNTYVSWYCVNEMTDGDNLPVGILLCTEKNHALVEYALAGMDNKLFVSKYQLELPKKEEIQRFLEEQIAEKMREEEMFRE